MKSWEKNIRRVVPYVPGEQPKDPKMIKLNTNENPYPPAKGVSEALKDMDSDAFRLYPAPDIQPLVHAIAKQYGVDDKQVFVGVGSDDVLALAFLTYFNSDKPILFPDITYSFYDVWAELFRIPYTQIPLNVMFQIRKEDYYIENGGIIIANPNAPTGEAVDLSVIEDILKHNQDSVVIVDEAYVDFGAESALSLIDTFDNLLVVQTFSKSRSMAGIRIGYAIGQECLINAIQDIKYSFNSYTMNLPSILLGVKAVEDIEYFEETKAKIIETREWTKDKLRQLGFSFPDSKANFIFAQHNKESAKDIQAYLRTKHIYVRYFDKERIRNYLRISIGTPQEMELLFKALEEYLIK